MVKLQKSIEGSTNHGTETRDLTVLETISEMEMEVQAGITSQGRLAEVMEDHNKTDPRKTEDHNTTDHHQTYLASSVAESISGDG